jgi:hypothetical protein
MKNPRVTRPVIGMVRRKDVKALECWVETPVGDEWVAASRVISQDGQLAIAELRIFPAEKQRRMRADDPGTWSAERLGGAAKAPPGGLRASVLPRVPLTTHYRFAQEFATELDAMDLIAGLRTPERVKPKESRPRRGRKGRPDLFYAEIAQAYVRAVEAGSRSPVLDVARRRRLPPPRMRDAVFEARERGLLARQAPGRGVGYLTQKAVALLAAKKKELSR